MRDWHPIAFVRRQIRDYWPAILVGVGAIGLSLLNLKHGTGTLDAPLHPRRWMLVLLAGLVVLAGECVGIRRQKRLAILEKDFESTELALSRALAALEKLARVELASIARELNYYSDERLSLFAWAEDHFELVVRYSDYPDHNHAARLSYGTEGGCLVQAWNHDRADLVISVARDADPDQWELEHVASGLPANLVRALRLPVRTIIAVRVKDSRISEPHLGVLVMESVHVTDSELVPGATGPVLEPDDAANAVARRMPRLEALLSVFAEIDEARPAATSVSPDS